jgi:hypothetical protein
MCSNLWLFSDNYRNPGERVSVAPGLRGGRQEMIEIQVKWNHDDVVAGERSAYTEYV